jgi:hypothetical protein
MEDTMKWTIIGAALLMLCSMDAVAQTDDAIVLRSCEGDVTITDNLICIRGYEFSPVACIDNSLICLKSENDDAEALLDLSKPDTLCLTILEGNLQMRLKCCWKSVFRGDEPLLGCMQDRSSAALRLRSMINEQLGTLALRRERP